MLGVSPPQWTGSFVGELNSPSEIHGGVLAFGPENMPAGASN